MFTLKINNTSNAAFLENGVEAEITEILKAVSERIQRGSTSGKCMDSWGNSVGSWELKDEDEE